MEQTEEICFPLEGSAEKLIIVTGFGPFAGHEEVNASWEAVKLLPDHLDFEGTIYRLDKQEVAVEYEEVDKAVAEIWARKPDLVIHCGVHGLANCIYIEKQAINHRFKRADYAGKRLPSSSVCLNNCGDNNDDVIRCRLNLDRIIETIDQSCACKPVATNDGVVSMAKVSYNVGDYLCGYIYLKSLDVDSRRTLFIHVPPIDKPFSSRQISQVILQVVTECVRQVMEDMKDIC